MNAAIRWPIFLLLLAVYGVLFSRQEHHFATVDQRLSHPMSPAIQKIALGYLRQLGGEMQFIKASVFYGGVRPGRDPLEYIAPFAHHLSAAAALHPHFIDTYFLTQATLPHINKDYARHANEVLDVGMTALPDNFLLPFFAGFNHFYYLSEPLKAAQLFRHAAKQPDAPPILEHLANILSAEGGDIYAALIGLKGLYATETDEQVKKRYASEIEAFQKAATVLEAIRHYEKDRQTTPADLESLVPEYLPAIPDVGPSFFLEWHSPHLRVIRVSPRSKFMDSTIKW